MLFALESATGFMIDDDHLVIVSLSKGIREVEMKEVVVVENYRELPPAQLVERLRQEIRAKGIRTDNVILGLPRDRVVVRIVDLPLEVEENLSQVVRFQVEKFEPVEGEISLYDHLVIARDEEAKRIRLQILLAPSDWLREPLQLLNQLEIVPAALRVGTHISHRLLELHPDGYPKKQPCLIVRADQESLAFTLVRGQGRAFSERLHPNQTPLAEGLAAELQGFISRVDPQVASLSKMYWVGDRAGELLASLQDTFKEGELLWDKLRLKHKPSKQRLGVLSDSMGLALSGLDDDGFYNLLPPDKRQVRRRPSLVPSLVLGALALVMCGAVVGRDYVQRQRLLEQFQGQVQLRQGGVNETWQMGSQIDAKRAQLEELQGLLRGDRMVLRVLLELTQKLPNDSYLENLMIQGNRLNMTGYSTKASTLLTTLLGSKCLEKVEQRFIIPGTADKEKFRFEAEIVDCSAKGEE